jgi:hypothetical protein
MKRLFATLSLIALFAPVAASAATVADIETQIRFLLGQVAFLESQASGAPVTCALVASRTSVKVGESFELIWNTYGAQAPSNDGPSQFAQSGIETITIDTAGVFKYDMTFYGENNAQTTCTAKLQVTA